MVSIFSSRRTSLTCANYYTRNKLVSELKRLHCVVNRLLKCNSPGKFALRSCRIDNRLASSPIRPDRNTEIHHSVCRSDFIRHSTQFLFRVCSVSGNVSLIDSFIANNPALHELVIPPFTRCNSLCLLLPRLFDGSVSFHGIRSGYELFPNNSKNLLLGNRDVDNARKDDGIPTKKPRMLAFIRGNHTLNFGGLQ